jgi:hypothetical protein
VLWRKRIGSDNAVCLATTHWDAAPKIETINHETLAKLATTKETRTKNKAINLLQPLAPLLVATLTTLQYRNWPQGERE